MVVFTGMLGRIIDNFFFGLKTLGFTIFLD